MGCLKLVSHMLNILGVQHVPLQYWMDAPIRVKTMAHTAMLELLFNAHRVGMFQRTAFHTDAFVTSIVVGPPQLTTSLKDFTKGLQDLRTTVVEAHYWATHLA